MANNYDGYTETQAHTAARAWSIAMMSCGYTQDFRPLNTEAEADAIYAFIQAAELGEYASGLLKELDWQDLTPSAEQADLAERASGCWTSYTPSAKEISKRVQPEIKEAQRVSEDFDLNYCSIPPIEF